MRRIGKDLWEKSKQKPVTSIVARTILNCALTIDGVDRARIDGGVGAAPDLLLPETRR